MFERPWDIFREEKLKKIFADSSKVIDIGGGLRIDPEKNNRQLEHPWLPAYIKEQNTEYIVLDKVPDYNPDIVGDIHDLPFKDNSVEAIVCIAVLEHVEEPQKAVKEMYRVLKPGGYCYIYAPFLFYYHPMKGYYKDYYRFTRDGFEYMTQDFSTVEIHNIRGAVATAMNLFPFSQNEQDPLSSLTDLLEKPGLIKRAATMSFVLNRGLRCLTAGGFIYLS